LVEEEEWKEFPRDSVKFLRYVVPLTDWYSLYHLDSNNDIPQANPLLYFKDKISFAVAGGSADPFNISTSIFDSSGELAHIWCIPGWTLERD
jgi:hypothetical protein